VGSGAVEGKIIKKKAWEEGEIHKTNDNCTWWFDKHSCKSHLIEASPKYHILRFQKDALLFVHPSPFL
jgi:hypothetical protein